MSWRSRLRSAARTWLACLALQLAAVPVAQAVARPVAAVCVAAEPAPIRKTVREAASVDAGFEVEAPPYVTSGASAHARPPAHAHTPRVLVPRLYLRLLSIRC